MIFPNVTRMTRNQWSDSEVRKHSQHVLMRTSGIKDH
jgi:hypothetical protein